VLSIVQITAVSLVLCSKRSTFIRLIGDTFDYPLTSHIYMLSSKTWAHVHTLPSINLYLSHQTKARRILINRVCLFEIIIYPDYIIKQILNLVLSLEFVG
jgi:hypothetical protein